ncbi:MAG: hypothetical protein E2O39_14565 [Planctomycetota bacterium]|nr:MAG: hypothetical protein E2O39_14565 [Planctomycetota bacterium]
MHARSRALISVHLSVAIAAIAASSCRATDEPARLFPGYGGYHRTVSTASPEAQRWFDQGLLLVYGFNHDEAIRSFQAAADVDPTCAMAWWGVAYANGIDVNDPEMSEAANQAAWDAAQSALAQLDGATPVERALVEAVAARYAWPAPADRRALDEAYAAALGRAWADYPDDPDVAALYAESLMVLQPWDYWTAAGEPVERVLEIVAVLEGAMASHPAHPGANHFYIHAVEASSNAGRATAAADRLRDLVPGSGHLVHMPSHVYINTGRYADAAAANERAIAADEAYFLLAPPPAFYSLYFIHNIHFLAFALMMEGRYEPALAAARKLEAEVPAQFLDEWVEIGDGLMPAVFHVLIRFGRWDDIVAEPDYPKARRASRAIRHYARAVALANLDRTSDARAELTSLDALVPELEEGWMIGVNKAVRVLAIARKMAEGEILWREGRADDAYAALREAVTLEDTLVYDEPPGWMQPVRHALGALLLAGGEAAEAEQVYTTDLEDNPENAWSLLGLEQALRAQGRTQEAGALVLRLERAWARADVEPPASCYCGVRPASD